VNLSCRHTALVVRSLVTLSAIVLTILPLASPARAQSTMSHEETVVRMVYSKLDYLTQLDVVSKAALDSYSGQSIDEAQVQKQLSDAKIEITLSDFKAGPISEILNKPWLDYLSIPSPPQEILEVMIGNHTYKDNDLPMISWQTAAAKWKPADPTPQAALDFLQNKTVKEMLEASSKVTPSDIVYSRYISYFVTARFQSKSISYKALYLFGTDAKGIEKASPGDFYTVMNGLTFGAPQNFYPDGLLHSHLREVPVLAEWLKAHEMSDEQCSTAGTRDFCCVGSRCGVAAIDLRNALATPLRDGWKPASQ